ncbi:HEPN domain-containing protein [Micromonospora sp. 4G57]|uniref:HEPN domain-containing protein n=1 Tax=Micromonospora sicca TaxID=2202420 RepID=A0ABU5JP92_9ACTN|nr:MULTISPECIES: HEPN domain-containing protein [unclassified Micromonospora]MDZ5447758.1 HEPN domain-containing protein [Micromonospora sp. 4G57]MDZ5494469.1 HEPN domain-containing protein [Micromonospora sp. 4G53]
MADIEQDLLRPDLWELLLPAVRAARQAGREYEGRGKYVPRQSVTKYSENDVGWPQTTRDTLGSGTKDGPIDWPEMFGLDQGLLTRILVSEVSELARAVGEIGRRAIKDDELMRGVSKLAPLMELGERRGQVEFETVRRLIGTILNRADAVGAETDDALRSIYQQIERARFAKELSGDVIVPLVAVSFDTTEPIHVEGNTWIERLTQNDHRARAMPWLRQDNVSPYVAAAATHAVVLRDVRFPNRVHTIRTGRDLPPEVSVDTAQTVAEAVHIVTEKTTGYAQVLVRPDGWAESWVHDLPPLWSAWSGRAYPEELNDRRWDKKMSPVAASEAEEIARITRALKTAPKNVQIAARRCRRTTFRDDAEDMVLDVAIGIEALVGKEPDALTHRMAQRAAIALADDIPPENTYSLLKQFYSIRSKIAHGETPKRWTVRLNEQEWSATWTGLFLLRMLLRSRLLADKPWDATSLDERMLEKFQRPVGYPALESTEE